MKIFNRPKKERGYLNKIIRTYLPFIAIILTINITICLYISSSLLEKRKEAQQKYIQDMSDTLQDEFYELQQLSYLLMRNIKYEDYIAYYNGKNGKVPDYTSLKKLQNVLISAKSIKKNLTRILVFSPKNQLIVSDDGIYKQDEYYRIFNYYQVIDKTVFSNTDSLDYFKVYPTTPVLTNNRENEIIGRTINVIPIGISCLDLYSVEAIIEMNLQESYVQEQLRKGELTEHSVGLLLDSHGNVLSSMRYETLQACDIKTLSEYAKQSLAGQKIRIGDHNFIAYSRHLDSLAWWALYLTPQADYYAPVLQFLFWYTLVFVLIIFVCAGMIFFYSRKLYNPISNLLFLANESGSPSSQLPRDEISFIKENFESLRNTKLKLMNKIDKMEDITQKQILRQILDYSDDTINVNEINDTLSEYNIHMDSPYYVAAIFNIYLKLPFFSQYTPDEQKTVQKAIRQFISDQLHACFNTVYFIDLEEYRSLIILNDTDPNCQQKLLGILKYINDLFAPDRAFIQFSFAVSGANTDLLSLSNTYKQMKLNCQFYILNSVNPVIDETTMDTASAGNLAEAFGESLKSAVISGNQVVIRQLIHSIFDENLSEKVTPYRFNKVIDTLGSMYEEIGFFLGLAEKMDLSFKESQPVRLFDVGNARLLMEQLFWSLQANYLKKDEEKSRYAKYIDGNFRNPNLSLQIMADDFRLNVNYLSRLFKEQTGVTFTDYLTEIRINEAKKLIIETDMVLDDIYKNIGISSRRTFDRMFKKTVGVSPAMYRILNR